MGFDPTSAGASAAGAAGAAAAAAQSNAPVQLLLEEKLTLSVQRDGGLQSMEVSGGLQLLITDPSCDKVYVQLGLGSNPGYQFKTHPNIDKAKYSAQAVLGLRDASRAFPANSALGVLKWRFLTTEDSHAPLLLTCWPTATGDTFEVTLEYELQGERELRDVRIAIPLGCPPTSQQTELGDVSYDARAKALVWHIPIVDASNASANMEFVAPAASADAFFPIDVAFSSPKTLCELEVTGVHLADGSGAAPYSTAGGMVVDSYTVV